LRGIEIDADLILKATKVDGVYSADPKIDPEAVKYEHLTFDDVIEKKLEVMDLTAICLSRDHGVPIKVFNMNSPGALLANVMGDADGTLID
jgi:uridylate kinase